MANDRILIQEPSSASATKQLPGVKVATGAATAVRETMTLAGVNSSADILAVLAADPATNAYGAVVRPLNSSILPLHVVPTTTIAITGAATVTPAAGTTWGVGLSTGSTGRVELASGGVGGTSANPLHVLPTTTLPVSLTTNSTVAVQVQNAVTINALTSGSKIQVEPGAGSTFNVAGTSVDIRALVPTRDGLGVGQFLGAVYEGTTAVLPQHAIISVTATGNATILVSGTGAIVVLSYNFVLGTSGTAQWFASSTHLLSGPKTFPTSMGGGMVVNHSPVGHFRTASGENLALSLNGATGPLGGELTYVRVAS